MIRPSYVATWLLTILVLASSALAKDSYERSFVLKVPGIPIPIGQVIVSFEDRISPGSFTFDVSTGSPSGSVFPPGVFPYSLPLLPGISLPVYITIKTTVGFRGPAKVGLHLEIMDYDPGLPLRLNVADGTPGGLFNDITAYQGPGSMYTSGYRDGFSEFVIAWDGRATASVIKSKFADLNKYLNDNRNLIDRDRYEELRDLIRDAIQAYNQKDIQGSINELGQFVNSVRIAIANNEMPSTFNDPQNPFPNVAGALIMLAETTEFSLGLLL